MPDENLQQISSTKRLIFLFLSAQSPNEVSENFPEHILTRKHLNHLSFSDPEKPEPDNVEKEAESRRTPETYTCNGSASRKTCKHQSKRERLEREKELLRQQEEAANEEEEGQDTRTEGEDTLIKLSSL